VERASRDQHAVVQVGLVGKLGDPQKFIAEICELLLNFWSFSRASRCLSYPPGHCSFNLSVSWVTASSFGLM